MVYDPFGVCIYAYVRGQTHDQIGRLHGRQMVYPGVPRGGVRGICGVVAPTFFIAWITFRRQHAPRYSYHGSAWYRVYCLCLGYVLLVDNIPIIMIILSLYLIFLTLTDK